MSKTTVISKTGKVYTYEYKFQPIWIRPELHQKLKSVASKHNISMNVLVEKLLESQEPKIEENVWG
jgi:predicted HicB family RNase H-like nuclease